MRYGGSKLKKTRKNAIFVGFFYHKSGDKIYDNLLERSKVLGVKYLKKWNLVF